MKPLCENGCGREATYTTKGGKHQCRPHHRSCPAVLEKGYKTNLEKYGGKQPAASSAVRKRMAETTVERFGVANASSSAAIKEKRKQVMIERYGVSNAAHIPEARTKISSSKKEFWNGVYDGKDFSAEGLTRLQYTHRAHQYAETQYKRHQHIIDPEGKRGKHWHLDHIYSLTDGFLNDVPINVISDISNLRLISDKENYKKNKSSHKSLEALYEDYSKSS
jgi:hypothetical protein